MNLSPYKENPMRQNRTSLFLGVLLILIGAWLVLSRQVPSLQNWLDDNFTWPMWTIGPGCLCSPWLAHRCARHAVPASTSPGSAGSYYQNATDDYASWSYMWTDPGFAGVGTIPALLGENTPEHLPACPGCHQYRAVPGVATLWRAFHPG
jgi:hypothetical protein